VTQLHVNIESRLYLRLKIAVKELGYGTVASWARSMVMSTIREAELRSTNRSKDIHRTEK
jgi:hypothetical protein